MEKVDFLWESNKLLEGRINLLNSNASVIIAIETAYFTLIMFLLKSLLNVIIINWTIGITFIFLVFVSGIIIIFALAIIRPTDKILGSKISVEHISENHLIWPSKKPNIEFFLRDLENYNPKEGELEIANNVFVRHQLIRRKYKRYHIAIVLAKLQVLITFLLMIIIFINDII